MKKVIYALLVALGLSMQANAAIYSFEDGAVPSGFTGSLQVTNEKYKLGTHSLLWNWSANATLNITEPAGLATVSKTTGGGIAVWIYNPAASGQSLDFRFQNASGQQKCSLSFKLNFKGWRCLWARFSEDMQHDKTQLSKVVIKAPDSGSGKLYFDYLEFQSDVSWERMSDRQYAVKANGLDDFVATSNRNPSSFPNIVTDEKRQAAQTIANRLEAWFFPAAELANNTYVKQRTTAFNAYVTRGRNKIPSLALSVEPNGTVTGPGLFPQYAATTIDGTGITRFRDINEQYLIQLAYDYRKNNYVAGLNTALNIFDWMNDQGWASGSAIGTLRFERLRSSGYFYGFFLLRNQLGAERLQRELNTLNWLSLTGSCFQTANNPGENTDDIRTLHIARLIHALSQPDDNMRLSYLQAFVESINNSYDIAHGYLDCFKPDLSGYHHRGVYYSSYYPEALYSACLIYYLLHDTPYALSNDIYNRLKQSLLAFRFIAAGYDVPVSTSGRFPDGNTALDNLLPAFAYLILSQNAPDEELTAAFKRLWQPTSEQLQYRIGRVTTAITFQSTIGEVESMVRAAALGTSAEQPVTGALYQPFAGLFTVRNPQWILSAKGTSKYVWDYEASSSENIYGRYLSYGHLEWTNLQTGKKSFNNSVTGWDWSRLPGTTYKKLSAVELNFNATSKHRNFSTEPFLGGVVLNDATAFFSLSLADNTFDKTFKAKKSVLAIGNVIFCMGSAIQNTDAAHPTETALFQNAYAPATESIKVNGNDISANQTNLLRPVITDNYGNVYKILSGNVNIELGGSLATAYINHGITPQNAVYQYAMLPAGGSESVLQGIEVKKQDADAHYIYEASTHTSAIAVYKAGDNLNYGLVKRVNSPSLLLLKEDGDNVEIVFSDPDMRQSTATNIDNLSDAAAATVGQSFNYELEINGLFDATGGEGLIVTHGSATTTIKATVKEGKSYRIKLRKQGSGIEQNNSHKGFSCVPTAGGYLLQSALTNPFGYTVTDASGRNVFRKSQLMQQDFLPAVLLPKGVYIIRIFDDRHEQFIKISR